MALTGRMRDFGISEILQLIGHQKKSGSLRVKDKLRKVEILFDQGNIVAATAEPLEPAFDLGASLARAGLISQEQLAAGRKESQETLKPIEQVLISARAVTMPQVIAASTLTRLEAIYSLFLWKDGDYSFEAEPVTYPQQWTQPISSEQVLMDGYRIKDEWPQIEKVLPHPLVKLERTPEKPVGLNPEQKKILLLIDGDVTAEDVAFKSLMGRFEAFKVVRELIERNLVSVSGTEAGPVAKDPRALFLQVGAAAVAALAALALALGIYKNYQRVFRPDPHDAAAQARQIVWSLYQQDRVVNALSTHAALSGSYPKALQEMVDKKELKKSDILTPFGKMDYALLDPDGHHARLTLPLPGEKK